MFDNNMEMYKGKHVASFLCNSETCALLMSLVRLTEILNIGKIFSSWTTSYFIFRQRKIS
jgi:hypothetical protein